MGDRKSPFPRFPEDYAPSTPPPMSPQAGALKVFLDVQQMFWLLLQQQLEEYEIERRRVAVADLPFTLLPPRGQA